MFRELIFPEKFTGYHMLGIMGLFFGTIITVNLTLAFFAAGSWTGLIVKNTYIESQIFDEKKATRQQQLALGWSHNVNYANGQFELSLKDAKGRAITADRVEAKFERPIHEQEDATRILSTKSKGLYAADIELKGGIWQVEISVYEQDTLVWSMPVRIIVGQ